MSTEGSRLVLTPVAGRRRGRLAVAAWLAALVAVVSWVLAAGIGTVPRDGRSAAAPGAGASSSGRSTSPTTMLPTPHASGSTELLGGSRPSGTVWLQAGNAVRSFDLASGKAGPTIDTGDWRDRVLYLPDGHFVCVCVDVTATDDQERAIVRLTNIVDGKPTTSKELATLVGTPDDGVPADEGGYAVITSASLSPDGSLIAVGLAVRRPPSWERSVLVVAVAGREVVQRIDLDPLRADPRVMARAPWVQFSPSGERALVSLTVDGANTVADERHFVAWIHGQLLGLEPVAGFGTMGEHADGRCSATTPEFSGYETLFAICHDENWSPSFLRSVAIDSGAISELNLGPVLEGSWPLSLLDGSTLLLWDPFSHHVARVHVPSAKLERSAVINMPTAGLKPLEQLARSFSAWIAPATLAKVLLEPGLALSPDGRTLYVVAMSGEGVVEPGKASTIHVLDSSSLAVRATWTVDPDVVSIAVTPAGDVLVGMLPIAGDGVTPEAVLTLLDADTGTPLARYDGLGTAWPLLIEPAAINR